MHSCYLRIYSSLRKTIVKTLMPPHRMKKLRLGQGIIHFFPYLSLCFNYLVLIGLFLPSEIEILPSN